MAGLDHTLSRRCILHELLKWDGILWWPVLGLWRRRMTICGRHRCVLGRWRILRHRLTFHLILLYALEKFVSPLVHERVMSSVAQLAPWFLRAKFCCMSSLKTMKTQAFLAEPLEPLVHAEIS